MIVVMVSGISAVEIVIKNKRVLISLNPTKKIFQIIYIAILTLINILAINYKVF